ncbi:methyltransferase domain-containing protein [Allokutzneria sp. A3M-2-11 16]|uniref:class I SAM-dependent methyltransferase n=1 Tax=Allokutzneria sp. A3M-2-11 16 TaxID=2962043 RepID=UPI0020B68E78|nr:class I SAM-dependent methyltransferase [Allokutzneria sp. A3M-2-11 16]MCP3802288.1 methyltransferase domain-containing protein [Allokutzneria sp. A3M-2-11 16]
MSQSAEEFLKAFHDNNPGLQSVSVEASRTAKGRTSYEEFADRVDAPGRVLDLGCADGALLEVLAGRGARTLAGVDLSAEELELARRRPALVNADLRRGRAQELPFENAAFDAVVSHMALMLMTDVEQVVAEVARVLVPGGVFAVALGGGAVEGEGMALFLELARPHFEAAREAGRRMPRMGDRKIRTREGLDAVLTPAGFAPVSWDSIVLDQSGTPEKVWETNVSVFYDVEVLDEDQIVELRREFLDKARSLVSDGRLPCGMRINIATTRRRAFTVTGEM